MAVIELPYGKGAMTVKIPDDRLLKVLKPSGLPTAPKDQADYVRSSIEHPVASLRLSELSYSKRSIVVVASDHTRPVPSKLTIPPLLEEIRKGNPAAQITILVATGAHRATSMSELEEKFGSEIMKNERIAVHDCEEQKNMVHMGKLPSGGELWLNRIAVEADLLVSEGCIEPHFFAGFSGGRKSVMPGIAGRETVYYNHNAEFIDNPHARTGILADNPIHIDMMHAAKTAGLGFICNVALNAQKEVVLAVSGDYDKAHQKGCEFLLRHFQVERTEADIVITTNGGYPLDQNIYQAVKSMTTAEANVRKGGVIIVLAKSVDGHGGDSFYATFQGMKPLDEILADIRGTPKHKTIPDQWQSQIFIRVLKHAHVIFVSDAPDEIVRDFRMIPAHTVGEAVKIADDIQHSQTGKITVIPDGVSVITK